MSSHFKQVSMIVFLVGLSLSADAAERASGGSPWGSLFFTFGPLMLMLVCMPLVLRIAMQRTRNLAQRTAEANERIAKSLEELVELMRKNGKADH